ncbi:MAG: hypothetical protein HY903_18815, partial [Deltaproteobacteria bacterium]|nr:hypothetical protein [Deltaproteobacteria bacterium]
MDRDRPKKGPDLVVVGTSQLQTNPALAWAGKGVPDVTQVNKLQAQAATHDRPLLRRDLVVEPGQRGTVSVRAPDALCAFQIYDIEWECARLMDGSRTTQQIVAEMAKKGTTVTPEMMRSVIRDLKAYKFLDTGGPMAAASPPPGPQPEAYGPEEKSMLETAALFRAKGDIEAAENYLQAVLEINPDNQVARTSLTELQRAPRPRSDGGPSRVPPAG